MHKKHWIAIGPTTHIPVREGRAVRVGTREIAIFNLGGRFVAIDNQCPHKGGPLCDGIVAGTAVVCPLHGWKIDLAAGNVVKPEVPVCVETFRTRVDENGIVFVERPSRELALEDGEVAA
ncbi:MAG TPA: nitrite reductase small subunit NirD [Bryobacteraceae bacterium]|jgi:nitrite reductase (NADH) small subunit|nr:nitrite reductase small subunit NirD [Bryobacteraceae bacterium]